MACIRTSPTCKHKSCDECEDFQKECEGCRGLEKYGSCSECPWRYVKENKENKLDRDLGTFFNHHVK